MSGCLDGLSQMLLSSLGLLGIYMASESEWPPAEPGTYCGHRCRNEEDTWIRGPLQKSVNVADPRRFARAVLAWLLGTWIQEGVSPCPELTRGTHCAEIHCTNNIAHTEPLPSFWRPGILVQARQRVPT